MWYKFKLVQSFATAVCNVCRIYKDNILDSDKFLIISILPSTEFLDDAFKKIASV